MASTATLESVTRKELELIPTSSESFVLEKGPRISGEVVKEGGKFHFKNLCGECENLIREVRHSYIAISYSM